MKYHSKVEIYFHRLILLGCLISLLIFVLNGCSANTERVEESRSDVILIDAISVFGELERSPVEFKHDKHTQTLAERGKDCDTCHPETKDGYLSTKFKRLTDNNRQELMELYHDNCIECHQRALDEDLVSGPVTCGECHKGETITLERQPMQFDKSMHQRHIDAAGNNCEECHHEYNVSNGELYYEKYTERSCRACHEEEFKENYETMRTVSHWDCIDCHRTNTAENKASGPATCEGCHDINIVLTYRKLDNVPRLDRNQPDVSLIMVSEENIPKSKMKTVPFNHKLHEEYVESCYRCHDEELTTCSSCHKLVNPEKATGVNLEQAFHSNNAGCLGCHIEEKEKAECAGCHTIMGEFVLEERHCEKCHTGPMADDPAIKRIEKGKFSRYLPKSSYPGLSFSNNVIKDVITIDALSDKYEAVEFPHKRIIDKLREHAEASTLAKHFHGNEDTLCQGCHHNSPVSEVPPLCSSCHTEPFNTSKPGIPGIKGAYHLQCMSCHTEMGLEDLNGCESCHVKKK